MTDKCLLGERAGRGNDRYKGTGSCNTNTTGTVRHAGTRDLARKGRQRPSHLMDSLVWRLEVWELEST